jgi:hypothetical protein
MPDVIRNAGMTTNSKIPSRIQYESKLKRAGISINCE